MPEKAVAEIEEQQADNAPDTENMQNDVPVDSNAPVNNAPTDTDPAGTDEQNRQSVPEQAQQNSGQDPTQQ